MFRYLATVFLFSSFAFGAPRAEPDPFVVFTIAKSGSHLLTKTLHLMTGFAPKWSFSPAAAQIFHTDRKFLWTHFCLPNEVFDLYLQPANVKKIVGIRDLRDVAVSTVHQILKGGWPGEFAGDEGGFKQLCFDEQLLYVINQDYEPTLHKTHTQLSLCRAVPQAIAFCATPDTLVCRYEDLVGPSGGGSKEAQIRAVEEIARHIGICPSKEELSRLADCLYGDSFGYGRTFREGKIGGWKKVFKEEHKQAFKQRLGSFLIELGYEKDDQW